MRRSPTISRRQFLGEASCAGISALPVLSTLLNLRLAGSVSAANAPGTDYRALVWRPFLGGGNDSYNMLVPREPSAYATYKTSRSSLALSPEQLIDLHPIDSVPFALHHRMPELATLREWERGFRGERWLAGRAGCKSKTGRGADQAAAAWTLLAF